MKHLRVLDTFAGIGGFSYGLEMAEAEGKYNGYRTVAFIENGKRQREILERHWPDIPLFGDIQDVRGEHLTAAGIAADVITAGWPCQDISLAGGGAGITGQRSGLFSEVVRLTSELGPRYVLMENVSALLGRGLGYVLGCLAEIGYDAEWHCIPASYIGAWHRRDRIWILAYPRRECDGQGIPSRPILGQSDLSRPSKRVFARWTGRSNLPRPKLSRGANGLSRRLDCLGNALVPQIPEAIGKAILDHENRRYENEQDTP